MSSWLTVRVASTASPMLRVSMGLDGKGFLLVGASPTDRTVKRVASHSRPTHRTDPAEASHSMQATTVTAEPVERPQGFWDGTTHAYLPGEELRVPEGLELDTDEPRQTDPVTYEVIRHALWNANGEHGRVIENLAVSPIAVEIRDFQSCILTESGEILYFGPYLQYMSGQLDIMVKYLIEHRGARLADGDMWLCNDPIVGTAHQPDVCLMCPVFVGGRVFCWVANVVHQNDIGGIVPGSFCPNAPDVFSDPPCFPPMRIVRGGQIDEDLEELYRRCSRTPTNLSLDLRATVAGNHAARSRILALVDGYGKDVVKGVMRRVIDASQRAYRSAMETIPDGVYSERLIQEVAVTGDRGTYPVQMNVRKEGARLTFDNVGTAPQAGAINVAFAGWRGGILGALNVMLLADQMGCVGGAVRDLRFAPEPATLTCPDWGAAVSAAGVYATHVGVSLGSAVVAKMMLASSDETIRDRALSPEMAQWNCHFTAGTNQKGDFYVGGMGDTMLGATGATWRRDGEFANGHYWIPDGRGPNVERYESDWPVLYLFRREHAGSGGAGRFRAGNGGELAYVLHRGEASLGLYCNEGIPKTNGILGGGPGWPCVGAAVIGSDIRKQFAAGRIPSSLDELDGERPLLAGKGPEVPLSQADVLYWNWAPPGGYGDPMLRDAELVAADVAEGHLTTEIARAVYGAALNGDGRVDVAATAERRAALFAERLDAAGHSASHPSEHVAAPAGAPSLGDVYWIDRDAGCWRCHRCGHALGPLAANPKLAMAVLEHAVHELLPGLMPVSAFVDDEVVWRQFLCPGCGVRMATEAAYPDEPPLQEFSLG
jgi:N-methylhydantoinase B